MYTITQLLEKPEKVNQKLLNQWRKPDGWERVISLLPLLRDETSGSEVVKIQFQSELVKAKVKTLGHQPHKHGVRGKITDFSAGSRGRVFEMFARFKATYKPVFVTLTYGDDYPSTADAKRHLHTFLDRIRRKLEGQNVSAVWRMELQQRGAPHFHIMFFGLPFIDKLTIQYWWEEITFVPEPFTRIELIRSRRGVRSYVSKYMAKVNDAEGASGFNPPTYLRAYSTKFDNYIGRQWGVFNRAYLPFAPLTIATSRMVKGAFLEFRRVAEGFYPPLRERISLGFKLFVTDAEMWLRIWHYLFDKWEVECIT